MTHYRIKYCVKRNGKYTEVSPEEAVWFRVFRLADGLYEWVHDFGMLSRANAFIEKAVAGEDRETPAAQKLKALTAAGEDYEWYPSTDEILEAFSKDLYAQAKRFSYYSHFRRGEIFCHDERRYNDETGDHDDMVSIESMLDVGAGDGRVFNSIKDLGPKHHFKVTEKYGIEKAKAQSDDLIRKGVFIIGRDFFQTTLIDKEFSVIYSNPPYSIYGNWTVRLLREASFGIMYLVLPVRWETHKEIMRELKNYEYANIGEYDFLHGDRAARARVNLIRITRKVETYDNRDYMKDTYDPFVRWIEENIGRFEEEAEGPAANEEKWLKTKSGNTIDETVEDYNYEMETLIEGAKAIGRLPMRVIKAFGMDKESIIKIIKQNIASLKGRYWRLAFDRLDPIAERLTAETRHTLIAKMSRFSTLDFNHDNIYSIIIWVIENFNLYVGEQMVELFKALTEPDYIKEYKSNRHWDKDTWRWNSGKNPYAGEKGKGKPEKYSLEYRIVTRSKNGYRGYNGNYSVVSDLIIVLRSLGADIHRNWENLDTSAYGELQRVMMNGDGRTWEENVALECRFYQNGNVHLKINQDLMMKFNIEAARLLGWVRGPQDIQDEFEMSGEEAAKYWNRSALQIIGRGDFKALEFKGSESA